MIEKGFLYTCDICGKNAAFLQFNKDKSYPDRWVHFMEKDICPDCYAHLDEKKEMYKLLG